MDGNSLDITRDLLEKLKSLVPQAFAEDKVDLQKLQTLLGEAVNVENERYQLSWAGKSEAYKVLQMPTTATLIPQPEQSVNWDEAENIFIEGENLEVLKVLQKSYYNKIKMIYIDPPYNTGSDSFIYPDKFSETKEEYLKRIGEKDEEGYLMKEGLFRKNSKENGQFHSNWLNMMLPRLFLARNLLTEDGLIFVSIDDNEYVNLKLLIDEVFGEENNISTLIWKKSYGGGAKSKFVVNLHEYILVYCKSKDKLEAIELPPSKDVLKYYKFQDEKFPLRGPYRKQPLATTSMDDRPNLKYPINWKGQYIYPEKQWQWSENRVLEAMENDELVFTKKGDAWTVDYKQYLKDEEGNERSSKSYSVLEGPYTQVGTKEIVEILGNGKIFPFPKPSALIRHLLLFGKEDDIVLDFFSGSATLAHSILTLNEEDGGKRKFICVQLAEKTEEGTESYIAGYKSISEVAEARIKKVIERIQANRQGKLTFEAQQTLGFRKYTLSPSNFKIWRGDVIENEEELIKQMSLFVTPQKANAETENILWELLIKNGVPLTEKVVKITLPQGETIFHTADKRLAFVLDEYTPEVQACILEIKPRTLICLDSLFHHEDKVKTNAQLKMEDNGITFKTV